MNTIRYGLQGIVIFVLVLQNYGQYNLGWVEMLRIPGF